MSLASVSQRVKRKSLLTKFVSNPQDLIPLFKDGMHLGWSGFTGVGYPKVLPIMLADHVEKNNLQGKLRVNLYVGASTGAETEDKWAQLDMIDRRIPYQLGKHIQDGINSGRIRFADTHLSKFPQDLLYGYYTLNKPGNKLDIAIIEATEILEDGSIVLGASVGATAALVQAADKLIIEVNTHLHSFKGLHDIVPIRVPPNRKPLLVTRVDDRIGSHTLPIDHEKVIAVIESTLPDNTTPNDPEDDNSNAIANHLLSFLQHEVSKERLPPTLLPLQSGIGNISNAIVGGLARGPFKEVTVWTEVLQDTFLDFFDQGKLKFASATSIRLSQDGFQRFYDHWNQYADKIILRSQNISNSPEIIGRLGVIAMNTPVEFDIYGHANSTNVMGSRMINGLGGSADFLRNSKLSIMHTPSTRPTKSDPHGISCVVPMCSHVDQTEHDIAVFVTEQGLADLRGLSPKERAREIIDKCAHPYYKDQLMDYYKTAEQICLKRKMAHIPHMLDKVFKMHTNLMEKGTMKLDSW